MSLHRLTEYKTSPQHLKRHFGDRLAKKQSENVIFGPECIFCDKIDLKLPGRSDKKEKPIKVTLPTAWKWIEPQALALGNNSLNHKVKDVDLFAKEPKFHPSC